MAHLLSFDHINGALMTSDPPSGTVTFLFTDIQGSTKLAHQYPDAMPGLLARHNAILKQAIEAHHGFVFRVIGDSFAVSFHNAHDALHAAVEAQRSLQREAWSPAPIFVRMGLHTGAAVLVGDSEDKDYSGYATLALTNRIMSAGHGGQILLSQSTYELTRDRLPESAQLMDLGEHRLKDILRPERLYQLNIPDLPGEFPPILSLDAFPNNLPLQLTSFLGREKEIGEVDALLLRSRLVTLTGSGGTGKTRLALEIAAGQLANFEHGVWEIDLSPLSEGSQILPALAQALGLHEFPPTPLATLVMDYLRDKKILLMLDNCEHLIAACARLVDDLLHQCAQLKILATSREALGIAGETAYRTPSLADSESVQLFVDRARATNPQFARTEANAASIAQICSRLDGIPLAIELAAARIRLLSPDQIAARLNDRFRLLVGGSRTALPRQQTLRAMIDWSYDLLSEQESRLLRTASVFAGGWTLDALEAVAEDPTAIEHLEQLVNKSLVTTEERGNEMRYFMLETIRQYAREKLFDAKQGSAARDRHFAYFNRLSESLWDAFRGQEMRLVISTAKDELENLRAALEWGLDNHTEENLRLAANFCMVSSWLGILQEGVTAARAAVDRAKALPPAAGEAQVHRQKLFARALFAQGTVGFGTGNMPAAIESLREAIAIARLADDKTILGYSLEMYYSATAFKPMPDRDEAAQEGLRIFRDQVNDDFGLGMAELNMARLATERGDEAEKQVYFEKLRDRIRKAPGSFGVGMFFLAMGMDEEARGNHAAAKKHFEDGLLVFKGMGNLNFQRVMRSELGHLERRIGNLPQARLIYRETLKGWQAVGNRSAVAHQLECFGFIAFAEEEPERTARLFGAAEVLRQKVDSPMTEAERVEYDRVVAQLRATLSDTEFNAQWAEGRALPMDQAIQLALEEMN